MRHELNSFLNSSKLVQLAVSVLCSQERDTDVNCMVYRLKIQRKAKDSRSTGSFLRLPSCGEFRA